MSLYMEDNGIGISLSDLHRVFDKGFTGQNGRKNEKATGMGLYLCEKLCGKLGIEISADSEETVGTKIIMKFPVSTFLIRSN